eukprot:TRINITY_DN5307_c0_g1_i1.p1 TRINITY_DN5307_c0_g1~~TRINITY_DN5307_c0_g1_i1.p1  ORF type:complete len:138 (-),score=36.17 TRINITY_DN5307_c0_g1_i1:76-489(-)
MTTGNFYFIIVGKNDNPIYQTEHYLQKKENTAQLAQFIIHSSLDVVDEIVWKNSAMYLKVVDRYLDQFVSAFVTAGNVRFMLLHDFRNEDGIKAFFSDVYELYMKILLNPFYTVNAPITSPTFDARVKALAKKHLRP